MVAPRDRDVRLLLEQLDHLVDARPAIAEVAGDHELADRQVAHDARLQHANQLEIAIVTHEWIDEPLQDLRLAIEDLTEQQLAEDRIERIGNDLLDVLERVALRELADHDDRAIGELQHERS